MIPHLPIAAAFLLAVSAALFDGGADLQLERSCIAHSPSPAACRRL